MQKIISLQTLKKQGLYDITKEVTAIVAESKVNTGLVSVYARGSTCAIMIQENWDESVQNDVICLLNKMIPHGVWEHDRQDNNGDAHLKSGLIGVSQTIPVIDGKPGLSTWQNIFFCEFDGPREKREVVVTVIE
jgi:secondary thiamine-phosphate synthase enzyme